MNINTQREWRFLDTEADRQALIADIKRVRRAVITLARGVPLDKHAEPRYHGWSVSAMLMHLYVIDSLGMLQIKAALIGISPRLPMAALNGFNNACARLFRQRLIETTIRQIETHQERISAFILALPIEKFTAPVWHPPSRAYLTVERALQAYFLFHWEEHLATMHKVDGIHYEPPNFGRA
jgi:hypothetical protein